MPACCSAARAMPAPRPNPITRLNRTVARVIPTSPKARERLQFLNHEPDIRSSGVGRAARRWCCGLDASPPAAQRVQHIAARAAVGRHADALLVLADGGAGAGAYGTIGFADVIASLEQQLLHLLALGAR